MRTTLLALLLVPALAAPASAHFELVAPAAYSEQDLLGGPQKSEPCGQADPGQAVVPTNAVTTLMAGSSVAITINEKVTHPGHYRVSIAADQASLPPDPAVQAGSTPCGSTMIEANPTLPLLADGLFVHTAALSGNQTVMVPLPAGMTCDHCVLQVTEFMSNHPLNNPGGCFYHHCAVVSISATAPPPDAGPQGGGSDAGTPGSNGNNADAGTGATGKSGGCAAGGGGGALAGIAIGAALVVRRRRR